MALRSFVDRIKKGDNLDEDEKLASLSLEFFTNLHLPDGTSKEVAIRRSTPRCRPMESARVVCDTCKSSKIPCNCTKGLKLLDRQISDITKVTKAITDKMTSIIKLPPPTKNPEDKNDDESDKESVEDEVSEEESSKDTDSEDDQNKKKVSLLLGKAQKYHLIKMIIVRR